MNKLYYTVFAVMAAIFSLKAQDAPTAAPAIRTFAIQPDVTGVASNSVNLFTGDVALPVNLVSIPDQSGLNINVSISYNSNVQNIVSTWNREAPGGVLGLGWDMSFPKIVVDHKQTGALDDDEYYLIEGGASNRLIRTTSGNDLEGDYYVYETKNYQFWKIKHYYTNKYKWEITREDGTKYIYGDKNSGRNTVQYVVRWDNWIGNSAQIEGQSQMPYVWNISEVVNTWGRRIVYEYDNVEQFVGSTSGQKHTEASYLKSITDPIGRKVIFFYNEKAAQYYVESHTEQAEPDAYQEVYEKKYLDHIDALDETATRFLSIHFGYGVINDGTDLAKMLLTSIEQRNSAGQTLPPMRFEYYQTGPTKGFLQKVTYTTGAIVSYDYSEKTIGHSDRKMAIQAPQGFAEPKIWMSNDYVVVAWRQMNGNTHDTGPRQVRVYVYQWVGEWKEEFVQAIGSVQLSTAGWPNPHMEYKDFQVITEQNFFAILSRSSGNQFSLYIKYKNESARGGWNSLSRSLNLGEGLPTLMSGTNFIIAASFKDGPTVGSYRYVFNGNSWAETQFHETPGDHDYAAANNFFISHRRNGINSPSLGFHYLTEDKTWQSVYSPVFSSEEPSTWHATNSFAFVLAGDNPEYVYRWSHTYGGLIKVTKDINNNDIFGELSHSWRTFLLNNSMIAVAGRLARFDGKYWHTDNITSTNNSVVGFYFSYGEDMVVRPVEYVSSTANYKGGRKVFNPNTLQWLPDYIMDGTDRGTDFANVGIDYYYFGNGYYYRQPNGTWIKKITYPGSGLSGRWAKAGYPQFDAWYFNSYDKSEVVLFKNGELSTVNLPNENLIRDGVFHYFKSNSVGNQTFVTYPGTSSDQSLARSLNLYRVVNNALLGKQVDYPVSLITIVNGTQTQNIMLDYNAVTAAIDPTGTVAQYNAVTVIPGSTSIGNVPNGYTKTYFHNGLPSAELFEIAVPTKLYYTGLPYEVRSYNANNDMVSYSRTVYTSYSRDITNGAGTKVEVGTYVRPTQTTEMIDGIVTTTNNTFDSNTGLLTQSNISGPVDTQIEYKYFWQAYDPTRERNILSPVILTKKKVRGQYTEARATRFKNWAPFFTVFDVYDEYVWKGTGSPDFSEWDVSSSPSPDWLFLGKVLLRDVLYGVVLVEEGSAGKIRRKLFDDYRQRVIAYVDNVGGSVIAFSSFEAYALGNIIRTDGAIITGNAKAGLNCVSLGLSGVRAAGLNANKTYTVSCWLKSSGGSVDISGVGTIALGTLSEWTLFEYTVTGLTDLTIRRTGTTEVLIDEVRVHPVEARMTTQTYHPVYGITSQTDQNNQVLYTEYDEWGRVKNVLDDNRNILKTHYYNYKN